MVLLVVASRTTLSDSPLAIIPLMREMSPWSLHPRSRVGTMRRLWMIFYQKVTPTRAHTDIDLPSNSNQSWMLKRETQQAQLASGTWIPLNSPWISHPIKSSKIHLESQHRPLLSHLVWTTQPYLLINISCSSLRKIQSSLPGSNPLE